MPPYETVAEVARWIGIAAAFGLLMWAYSTWRRILDEVNATLPPDEQIDPEISFFRRHKLWWEVLQRHRRSHPNSRLRSRYWRQTISGCGVILIVVLSRILNQV